MKRFLGFSMALALMVSAVLVMSGFSGAQANAAEGDRIMMAAPAHGAFFIGSRHGGLLNSDVHQKAYLTYLVNEYDPGSMEKWNEAFADRLKAVAEMPEKQFIVSDGESKPKFIAGPLSPPEKTINKMIRIESKDGIKLPPVRKIFDNNLSPEDREKMIEEAKAEADLQSKFEKAVESGDAAAIKELLPKILESYKKATQHMVEINEMIKKEMDSVTKGE